MGAKLCLKMYSKMIKYISHWKLVFLNSSLSGKCLGRIIFNFKTKTDSPHQNVCAYERPRRVTDNLWHFPSTQSARCVDDENKDLKRHLKWIYSPLCHLTNQFKDSHGDVENSLYSLKHHVLLGLKARRDDSVLLVSTLLPISGQWESGPLSLSLSLRASQWPVYIPEQ